MGHELPRSDEPEAVSAAVMMALGDTFGLSVVMGLAGPRAHGRGVAYHRDGRVLAHAADDLRLRATVRGSVPYAVALWVDGGEPRWSCTCPAAEDGSLCKHCVAAAQLLGGADVVAGGGKGTQREFRPGPIGEGKDLAHYLSGLDRERLEAMVLEASASDWRLRERLRAEARAVRGKGPELGTWRRRIDAAFAPNDDFVDYREAAGWAAAVDDVIGAIEELCDAGQPDAATVLAEHAHRRADEAIQYVDDSDGWLRGISERLSELHRRACAEGAPDPVELARRLVDLELTSELDGFHRAAAGYADSLGEDGMAEYRRLVEPAWARLGPATDARSSERFRVREAMIGLALASGDPEQLIEARRHDLRTPDDYLEVARMLAASERADEAIDWARRGLDTFADRSSQTPPLREFLARILRDRGDAASALDLFWDAFARAPSLVAYRRLLEEAGGEASVWRDRSVRALQARVAEARAEDRARRSLVPSTPAGALVEILAYEGDIDMAWASARQHGCHDGMWLTLARARETTHPLDAIEVYEREVLAQIDRKKNDAYRAAVDLMARIRRLADDAGQSARFEALLDRVRTEHKAKRSLTALLDRKGW